MSQTVEFRSLTTEEITTLTGQGCSALSWEAVEVAEGFKAVRVRNTHFSGSVKIGRLAGDLSTPSGLAKAAGIYGCYIANCNIGNDVRIANIRCHLADYDIGDGAYIEDVGTMQTRAGATFGNGVEVDVLVEAGGREVIIFNELSAQFAYLMCLHRYRPELVARLKALAKRYVDGVRSDRGCVGAGATICSAGRIIDVNIGPHAVVNGASSLVNGTVLSAAEAPTCIGTDVTADDFIVAEGSSVSDGAILSKTYVGQGCEIGKQFSAEACLFFANCQALHGEACAVFAGPYTVTHHKSTLLIAGLFSFYNAGSGTNQSNHMYKLGPVHEGKLERGSKTGSFSYLMWPCRVGPFSVVLGKHSGTFDTTGFPFSHIQADPSGRATMVPGLYLATVGTLRDGAKWPSRDQRSGSVKRDLICFDVLSPYTVGKMVQALDTLKNLQENTDRATEYVCVRGAFVRRPILRTAQKFYRTGVEMYLLEKLLARVKPVLEGRIANLSEALAGGRRAVHSDEWVDIAGQLMPQARLESIIEAIERGACSDGPAVQSALREVYDHYAEDEWLWVRATYEKVFGCELGGVGPADLLAAADAYLKVKGKFLRLVIADAEKEFDQLSRTGFGQDGGPEQVDQDFDEVRGLCERNDFFKQMYRNLDDLPATVNAFKEKLEAWR